MVDLVCLTLPKTVRYPLYGGDGGYGRYSGCPPSPSHVGGAYNLHADRPGDGCGDRDAYIMKHTE